MQIGNMWARTIGPTHVHKIMKMFRISFIYNAITFTSLIEVVTLKLPEKLQLYGLYVYYLVHICDFGMLRVNMKCIIL